MSGCATKPIETIDCTVIDRFYTNSDSPKAWWNKEIVIDEYHMIVKCSDGYTRLHIFKGDDMAKYNNMYKIRSKVNLSKEGDNIKIIK